MSPALKRACIGAAGLIAALGSAAPALAHPGHGAAGLAQGFAHPLTGLDHLLAMVSVGLWASLRGGRATWAWPAAFVAAMAAGFATAQAGIAFPLVEPAVLASVIVLGGLTAAAAAAPLALGAGVIALFGLAHGYAHGSEAQGAGFLAGLAISTAGLQLAGVAAGAGLGRIGRAGVVRAMGAGAVVGGLALALAG